MKKLMLLAAGIVVSALIALAGCTVAQQAQVAAVAVNIQTQVSKACAVFTPVALDAETLYQLNPDIDLAINGLNGLCVNNAAIDPSSVQTLAKTVIPAAIKALGATAGITPALQQEIGGALTLANAALNLWVQSYVPTAAPAAGASGALPASAPAAASGPLAAAVS